MAQLLYSPQKCYQKIWTGMRKHAFPIKSFMMQQKLQQTELMWFPMLIKTIIKKKKRVPILCNQDLQIIKKPTNNKTIQHFKQLYTSHWTSVEAWWHQHWFLPNCDGSILPSKKRLGVTLINLEEKKIKSRMEQGTAACDSYQIIPLQASSNSHSA